MPIYSKTFSRLLPCNDPNIVLNQQSAIQSSKKLENKVKKRNKEQADDDSSYQTSKKKKQEHLSLAECKYYTREQIRTLLLTEAQNGKLLLSSEEIEQLYNINFDGQYIHAYCHDESILLLTKLKSLKGTTIFYLTKWLDINGTRSQILLDQIDALDLTATDVVEQCKALYYNVQRRLLRENPSKQVTSELSEFTKLLSHHTIIPSSDVKLGSPNFGKGFESNELPIYNNKDFAKHQLVYFSKFHYKMEKDDEILSSINDNNKSALMFMGASGVGKTSAAIRLLCKTPGMLLTCTSSNERTSGLTIDYLMQRMHEYLSCLDCYDLYGSVEQTILFVYICRLIYILKLIKNAKKNPNVINPFEGILPYLAFMQLNGKTSSSESAFYLAFSKYLYTPTSKLFKCCKELISEIIVKLNENSKLFNIKQELKNFIIVIDEANVFTRKEIALDCLISLNGKRGLIPIIVNTITKIPFHVSIFMGTNLSVNVEEIIQFSKEKISIRKYYDFGLIACDDLIPFLQMHINIPEKELISFKRYLKKNNFKFFRRRLVTFALEELNQLAAKNRYENRRLVYAFKIAIASTVEQISKGMVKNYFADKNSKYGTDRVGSLQEGIRDALVNYIAHYEFNFLKDQFHVNKDSVVDALLKSGFCGPEKECDLRYRFSSWDFLGFETGKLVLDMIINEREECKNELSSEEEEQVMKYVIESKIKFIMETFGDSVDRESIVLLQLALLDER